MAENEHVGTTPDHYEVEGEQHWDRQWRLYGRGYFVGQITKYLERYHKKGGLDDLKKANNFGKKLYELEKAAHEGTGPLGCEGKQPPVVAYHGQNVDPIVVTSEQRKFRNDLELYMATEQSKGKWLSVVGPVEYAPPEGVVVQPCDRDKDHDSHHFDPLPDYEAAAACRECGAHSGFPSARLPCPGRHGSGTAWGVIDTTPCPLCGGSGLVTCEWSTDPSPCQECQ